MSRTGGLVGAGLAAVLFLCPAEVAFSQEKRQGAVSWHDLEEASSEHLMTITTPPGFTPEDVMRTVLENHKLPPYIRQPFVELARAKAPHLLAQTMQVAARTELGAVR